MICGKIDNNTRKKPAKYKLSQLAPGMRAQQLCPRARALNI